MRHHVVYWKMARREAMVDDAELRNLREQEARREAYVEILDGVRLPLTWSHEGHHWIAMMPERQSVAA